MLAEEQDYNKSKLDFLYKAIDDAQSTIRFTDAKAGAVIAFWTLVLNVVIRTKEDWYNSIVSSGSKTELFLMIIFVFIMLFYFWRSLWMSYLTLVPRINPKKHINTKDFEARDLFFLSETTPEINGKYLYGNYKNIKMKLSAKDYHEKLTWLDNKGIEKELVIELQKISFIRNIKMARTSLAITSVINFIITIMLVFIYILGSKLITFADTGGVTGINFDISLFIVLYIGHKIADYLLQTNNQAINKSESWRALLTHCVVYTFVLTIMGYFFADFFNWSAIFIIFFSHVIIDRRIILIWWAKNIKKMSDTDDNNTVPTLMEMDQAFHYIIIFIVSCLK